MRAEKYCICYLLLLSILTEVFDIQQLTGGKVSLLLKIIDFSRLSVSSKSVLVSGAPGDFFAKPI